MLVLQRLIVGSSVRDGVNFIEVVLNGGNRRNPLPVSRASRWGAEIAPAGPRWSSAAADYDPTSAMRTDAASRMDSDNQSSVVGLRRRFRKSLKTKEPRNADEELMKDGFAAGFLSLHHPEQGVPGSE
jgi:hypothetical protein